MAVLVIAENNAAGLGRATLNVITAAQAFSAEVHVAVIGPDTAQAASAAAIIPAVSKVLVANAPYLGEDYVENTAAQILTVAREYSHILAPATAAGKNVAPRIAAQLDAAQISEVTKIIDANTFERPIYAGNAIATVSTEQVFGTHDVLLIGVLVPDEGPDGGFVLLQLEELVVETDPSRCEFVRTRFEQGFQADLGEVQLPLATGGTPGFVSPTRTPRLETV